LAGNSNGLLPPAIFTRLPIMGSLAGDRDGTVADDHFPAGPVANPHVSCRTGSPARPPQFLIV
jgi:hypothetical protein